MNQKAQRNILFIAGPTASGKSALALQIAQECNGEIVNADALQVYRELQILTARPTPADLARAPHHLYGTLAGTEQCSAGIWARKASRVVHDILARGRVPILVGGTGFYFRALEEGLSPIPKIALALRDEGGRLYDRLGGEAFREVVLQFDPAMTHLPAADRQRLIRAWEVYAQTSVPLSEFQRLPRAPLLEGDITKYRLLPARATLYANCDARFDRMIIKGALQEVATLQERSFVPSAPIMKALGVKELSAHLAGELALEQAVARAKMHTRRFAKRQYTWFHNQAADWKLFESHEGNDAEIGRIVSMILA